MMEKKILEGFRVEHSVASHKKITSTEPQDSLLEYVWNEIGDPLQSSPGSNSAHQNIRETGNHFQSNYLNEGALLTTFNPTDDHFDGHWRTLEPKKNVFFQETQQQTQNLPLNFSQVMFYDDQRFSQDMLECPLTPVDHARHTISMETSGTNLAQQACPVTSANVPTFSFVDALGKDNSPTSLVSSVKPVSVETPPKKKKRAAQIQDKAGWKWRKHGQKLRKRGSIMRSYYRCTMKDRGCPASLIVDTDVVEVKADECRRSENRWLPKEEHNHLPCTRILDEHKIRSFLQKQEIGEIGPESGES